MQKTSGARSEIRAFSSEIGKKPPRILIAKPGLDGHDRGALVVSRALRDAGFEVIYLGLYGTIDQIIQVAIQEDVEIIGLSILSGTHLKVAKRLIERIREKKGWKVKTAIGGIIPDEDIPKLRRLGIDVIVPTGTPISKVGEFLRGARKKGSVKKVKRRAAS
jgi:methylmalonyl-CoA mutase C-terminal domain/subunit